MHSLAFWSVHGYTGLVERRPLIAVHWEVLAVTEIVYPIPLLATEIARILRRTHGAIVGPVRELADWGFLAAGRAQTRKRGLRQPVLIDSEGRRALFSDCRASMLIAELEKERSLEQCMRLALVASVVFGTAGYCLIRLAKERRVRVSVGSESPEPFAAFRKYLRQSKPHVLFAFDELTKVAGEARDSLREWEIHTLEQHWWHVRKRFPLAVKAYEDITGGEDPDEVLRRLREKEEEGRQSEPDGSRFE